MTDRFEIQITHPATGEPAALSVQMHPASPKADPEMGDPKMDDLKLDEGDRLVIMMHGWGADASDLASLAPYLAPHLNQCHFIFPDAPYPCAANPFGREWFALDAADLRSARIEQNAIEARWIVHQMLDALISRFSCRADQIILGGFSQGGMMALGSGLSYAEQLGGLFCLSGALLGRPEAASPRPTAIFLAHGAEDMVVAPSLFHDTEQVLRDAGYHPHAHLLPHLAHGIDEAMLTQLISFLKS